MLQCMRAALSNYFSRGALSGQHLHIYRALVQLLGVTTYILHGARFLHFVVLAIAALKEWDL